MTAPLFLEPVFRHRIWGGRQLATRFGYEGVPDGPVGECWGISAHPSGPSRVVGGPHDGRTLAEVWASDRAFFGGDRSDGEVGPFPLLVKLLDARDWLSVQVHPDDAEAAALEGVPLGKTECWYVVDAEPGAELLIGHRASSRRELAAMIDAGRWDELLLRRKVAKGDFVYIPAGTVHAVGPGLLLCEVQQNSDTTYRVYDFDRTDAAGNRRQLHLDKAKRVITVPWDPASIEAGGTVASQPAGRTSTLLSSPIFDVTLHEVAGDGYRASFPTYELCTVTDGGGQVAWADQEHPLRAGDHLILPADAGEVRFSGRLTIVSSHPAG
jgi:mannose-6-phosphate isomerase